MRHLRVTQRSPKGDQMLLRVTQRSQRWKTKRGRPWPINTTSYIIKGAFSLFNTLRCVFLKMNKDKANSWLRYSFVDVSSQLIMLNRVNACNV